jgi:hypothetical protein
MGWQLQRLECEQISRNRWWLEYLMSDPEGNRAELRITVQGCGVERATLHYRERVFWFAGRDAWEFLRFVEFGLLGTRLAVEEWRGVLAEAGAGGEGS